MSALEKKRIVIGINHLAVGGAQHQLILQLPYYSLEKYQIHVVLLFKDYVSANLIAGVPKDISVHQFSFSGFTDIRSWVALYKKLRDINPHLVMSSLFFSNTVLRVLKLFLGYPIISREHNTYTDKRWIQIQVDRLLAMWTEKIVTVSSEVADFTSEQEHIKRDLFQTISNGIDISYIQERMNSINPDKVRAELSISSDDKILLHVGRLARQKNQALLLKGFAEFYKTHTRWKLVIVGGGLMYEQLKNLGKKLDIADVVIMIGEKEDVHPYYTIADCFITTSFIEGMSNTHLEALAHGLPILSTKTGGTSSIIHEGENGYIIPEYTPASVSETLSKLAESDIVAIKKSAKKIVYDFDIKKTVKEYETLFDTFAL